MSTVGYISAEQTSDVNTTATTYADIVSTGNLTPGVKYLLLCRATTGNSNTNQLSYTRMVDDAGSEFAGSEEVREVGSSHTGTGSAYSYSTVFTATTAAAVKIQQKATSGYTARLHHASILLLELSGGMMGTNHDWYHTSDATVASHTTSLVDRASLTVTNTASKSGNYLAIGFTQIALGSVSESYEAQMAFTNVTAYKNTLMTQSFVSHIQEGEDTDETHCDVMVCPIHLPASGTSVIKMSTKDDNSAVHTYNASSVTLLYLDQFETTDGVVNTAAVVNGDSTDQFTINSGTFSPRTSGKAVVVGTAAFDSGGSNNRLRQQFLLDTSSVFGSNFDDTYVGRSMDATDEQAFMVLGVFDVTAGSDHAWVWKGQTYDADSQAVEDRGLIVFSLERPTMKSTIDSVVRERKRRRRRRWK